MLRVFCFGFFRFLRASQEFGFEANPAGAVQWRRGKDIFYFAGEALGWRSIRADTWFFDVAVAFDEGREESDSDDGRLDGLGDSEEGTEVVLQVRRALDANWRYWLDGRVVTGDNGTLGLFGAGRRFGDRGDGTGSELSVVAVYHDGDRANADFHLLEVSPCDCHCFNQPKAKSNTCKVIS